MQVESLSVLGFGQLGKAVVAAARGQDVPTLVWNRRGSVQHMLHLQDEVDALGAGLVTDLRAAVEPASVVVSCVPGDVSLDLALRCAPLSRAGSLFADAASASPVAKEKAAEVMTVRRVDYVDAAVLGPVVALGPRVPWLVSGEGAERFASLAPSLGLCVSHLTGPAGQAARVKLIRSVYLKGRDALVAEMMLAAQAQGVVEAVVRSIGGPAEDVPFPRLTARILSSLVHHSERRAAELDASSRLLGELGVTPSAVDGAARRLRLLARRTSFEEAADRREIDVEALLESVSSQLLGEPS